MPPAPIPPGGFQGVGNTGRMDESEQVQPGLLKKNWLVWLGLGLAAWWLLRKAK